MKHKYADMHCFCSGYGGAAVVVYWQCYPHLQNSTLENSWNHMHNSKGDLLLLTMNTEGEQQQCREGDVLAAVCMRPQCKYTWSFQDNCCSRDMGIGNFAPWWFLSVSPTPNKRFCEWLQPRLQVLPDILRGWGSIYLGWYYKHKEYANLGRGKFTPGNIVPISSGVFI